MHAALLRVPPQDLLTGFSGGYGGRSGTNSFALTALTPGGGEGDSMLDMLGSSGTMDLAGLPGAGEEASSARL